MSNGFHNFDVVAHHAYQQSYLNERAACESGRKTLNARDHVLGVMLDMLANHQHALPDFWLHFNVSNTELAGLLADYLIARQSA